MSNLKIVLPPSFNAVERPSMPTVIVATLVVAAGLFVWVSFKKRKDNKKTTGGNK
jgi:hypothetical protein